MPGYRFLKRPEAPVLDGEMPLLTAISPFSSDKMAVEPFSLQPSDQKDAYPLIFSQPMKSVHRAAVRVCVALLRRKDHALYQHCCRVHYYCYRLGKIMKLSHHELYDLELAAFLHDIGKIDLPDALLQKAEGLTQKEFARIKSHSAIGARLLTQIQLPERVISLIYYHHERWNGYGYPDGLKGTAIPLGARIIALADAFDVITSHRPYQVARSVVQAFEELQRCAGEHFDPLLVQNFIEVLAVDRVAC